MVWVNPPPDGAAAAAAAAAAGARGVGATEGGGAVGGASGGFFSGSQQRQRQSGSGVSPPGMALHGLAGSAAAASAAVSSSSEDAAKKIRKPYTISKSRESWTEQEHDKFLEALHLFDRDWKKIEAFVGSKTVIQIRSHAQKYFLKVQKNGTSEHVPPPRPKRKAAHPYPQKASKNAPSPSHLTTAFQTPSCLLEQGYALTKDPSSLLQTTVTGATMSSPAQQSLQPPSLVHVEREDMDCAGAVMIANCCSSSVDSPRESLSLLKTNDQGNQVPSFRVMPDFVQVYNFLGNIFDPSTSGHLQKLREMDPIDVETVLLLMRNLAVNLTNPYFEDHKRLLSVYDVDMLQMSPGNAEKLLPA